MRSISKKCLLMALVAIFLAACGDNKQFIAMGIFESDEVLVSSEISGKIIEFYVREGDEVSKDELLAKIDTTELELQLRQLENQIEVLEAKKIDMPTQLAPIKEKISIATREQNRMQRLFKDDATTQKRLDDANSELSLLNKELASQESSMQLNNLALEYEIHKTQAQIDTITYKISQALIKSPIDGTILGKYAFSGEISFSNKPLLKVANTKVLRLKAYLIDTDITNLKLGDTLKIKSDFGDSSKEYNGTVTWISSKAEFTPKTIMTKDERENFVYAIKVDVQNDGFLKIGSYGEIVE